MNEMYSPLVCSEFIIYGIRLQSAVPMLGQAKQKMNIDFDGICSGFLGSAKQIEIVKEFFKDFKTKKNFILVDPVMGDHGKLYPTYTQEMQEKMRELMGQ